MDGLVGIIDDSELSLDILAEFLETEGLTVETTSDELNAVAWAEKLRPDLLLVDLTLSRGSGELLVQELKKRSKLPSPVVIYSAHELTYVAEAA
ncbi:MAG: Response regulator receiver domain, partial [Pseudomonadota bacterium]